MQKVFVYGTLKHGQRNNRLLSGLNWITASVRGELYLMPAGYPALVIGVKEPGTVHGHLFTVPDDVMPVLDQLECVSSGLYARTTVFAEVGEALIEAHAYTMTMEQVRSRGGTRIGEWPLRYTNEVK